MPHRVHERLEDVLRTRPKTKVLQEHPYAGEKVLLDGVLQETTDRRIGLGYYHRQTPVAAGGGLSGVLCGQLFQTVPEVVRVSIGDRVDCLLTQFFIHSQSRHVSTL